MFNIVYRSQQGNKSIEVGDSRKAELEKELLTGLKDGWLNINGVVLRKSQIVLIEASETGNREMKFENCKFLSTDELRRVWIKTAKAAINANPDFIQRMREGNIFALNVKAMIQKYKIQPEELGLEQNAYHV